MFARIHKAALDAFRRITAVPGAESAAAGFAGDEAVAPATFPAEAYNVALDRLVSIAHETGRETGAREERERMASIARLPGAEHWPRLALSIALAEIVRPELASAFFEAASRDVIARTSCQLPAAESAAPPAVH